MNKAIFLFTMKRYFHWVNLVVGSILLILFSTMCGVLLTIDSPLTLEAARSFLVGPLMPLIVSYSVISPQVANSQRRKDGEYLSLIFSRPIPRWSYVVTKWLTGSTLVLFIMTLQIALSYGISRVAGAILGVQPGNVLDACAIIDGVLNTLGFTALVVFISSMPQRYAVILVLMYAYFMCLLTFSVGTASYLDSLSLEQVSKNITALGQLLFSIFVVGFDSYHVINSATLPIANILIYLSNIALYLTLATLVMSYREFFYAND